MDSYFREANFGNERERGSGSSSSSSSRKGKKSNSDHKPKQPQRGLGVAQLEKIRLHTQFPPNTSHFNIINNEDPRVMQMPYSSYSSQNSYAFQPHTMMGLPEYERTNMRYGDSQPRWQHGNAMMHQSSSQTNITRPFLNLYDSQDIDIKKHRSGSLDSESSNTQELDLELKLSL